MNQPTENPYKSQNSSSWAFLQKPKKTHRAGFFFVEPWVWRG